MFDCNTCGNKQNGLMHCLFYSKEPEIDVCSGYQKVFNHSAIINEKIKKLTKRRAIELINTFQDLGYTSNNWCIIIDLALKQNNIDPLDERTNARFIRSFGANGLTFACNECGNEVELEDNSTSHCPTCGHSDFSFVFD